MTDFQDFEPAPVATARMTLADGRVFIFSAATDADGKVSFSHIDGTPSMFSEDMEQLVCLEHMDALGRVACCLRRAPATVEELTTPAHAALGLDRRRRATEGFFTAGAGPRRKW